MGPFRSCWNSTTSALQPEEITSKGVEFHVCTINKSAIQKKSGNLLNAPCICIKMNFVLNNLQWLICHKTKLN